MSKTNENKSKSDIQITKEVFRVKYNPPKSPKSHPMQNEIVICPYAPNAKITIPINFVICDPKMSYALRGTVPQMNIREFCHMRPWILSYASGRLRLRLRLRIRLFTISRSAE